MGTSRHLLRSRHVANIAETTLLTRSGHTPLLQFSGTLPESFLLRADEVVE
jgi:hypothetical protein